MATQLNPESSAEPGAAQLSDIGNRLRTVEIDVAVIKSNYATREDVANLEIKTQESISALEVKTQGYIGALGFRTQETISALGAQTQSSISSLEIRMAQMEARLIKWFVGTAITLSAVVGTIAFTAAKFIH